MPCHFTDEGKDARMGFLAARRTRGGRAPSMDQAGLRAALAREAARAARAHGRLAVALIEGAQPSDLGGLRPYDVAGRTGAGHAVLLLPDADDAAAGAIVERLRADLRATTRAAVAAWHPHLSPDGLLTLAEVVLAGAPRGGPAAVAPPPAVALSVPAGWRLGVELSRRLQALGAAMGSEEAEELRRTVAAAAVQAARAEGCRQVTLVVYVTADRIWCEVRADTTEPVRLEAARPA